MTTAARSRRRRIVAPLLLVSIALLAAVVPVDAASSSAPTSKPAVAGLPSSLQDRLVGSVAELYVKAERLHSAGVPVAVQALRTTRVGEALAAGTLRLDPTGAVEVDAVISAAGPDHRELARLGVVEERYRPDLGRAQYRVSPAALGALALLDGVEALRPPIYVAPNQGSRRSEGYFALRANLVRSAYGLTGAGVRIGVISNGIRGLAASQASGDAPVLFAKESFSLGGLNAGAEGTAMIEVIHDLAPGAQISFANALTDLDMIEAMNYLAERNDIVVDDLSFLNPGDQRSAVSVNSAKALNNPDWPVRALVTSVGNYATRHYEGVFEPGEEGLGLGLPATGTTHQFRASEETTDALNRGPLSWNEFFLRSGQQAIIALFWNDPWSDTKNDYDLYLLDLARPAGNRVVASSRGSQEGERGQVPREIIDFTNNGPEGFFAVVVQNWESRAPTKAIEIYVTSNSLLPGYATVLNFNTRAGSVLAQSDAGGGVISVGAIDQADPGLDTIERFSSRGPTNNGAAKPDIVAVDRVTVTGNGGFTPRFEGTSAAASHAAAIAALVLEGQPRLLAGDGGDPAHERARLRASLLGSAIDLGEPGPDSVYGHGRMDALTAVEAALFTAVVDSSADTGAGSLRAAIVAVNAAAGGGSIRFADGLPPIRLRTALPPITASAVSIEGRGVVIDGDGVAEDGVVVRGDDVLVHGLTLRNFGGAGLHIDGAANSILGALRLEGNGVGLRVSAGSGGARIAGGTLEGIVVVENRGDGVVISGPGTREVWLRDSYVGVERDGRAAGNGGVGVRIRGGAFRVVVGAGPRDLAVAVLQGPALPGGNVIAHNGGNGVRIEGGTSISNTLRGNLIHSNGALEIDLVGPGDSPSGLTRNDPGDADSGPNTLINTPLITLVEFLSTSDPGGARVGGTAPSGSTVDLYAVIDPAAASPTSSDPARSGGAARYLGSAVSVGGRFSFAVAPLAGATVLTALVTNAAGNTSEFGPNFDIGPAPRITGVSPVSGVRSGGVPVTIRGSGFGPQPGTQVFFGDSAAGVLSESTSELVVLAPPGAVGLVTVRVVKRDGRAASLEGAFAYRAGTLVTLEPGWNLHVWAGGPQAVSAAIASVADRVDRVFAYESEAQRWLGYIAGAPAFVNSLETLENGQLLWLFVTGDGAVVWEVP